MRPKENWEKVTKDRDGRPKRSSQPKKAALEQMPNNPANDASRGSNAGRSGASSPMPGPTDGARGEDVNQMAPQLPVNRRPRALSVQLSPMKKNSGLSEGSAALALKMAIQSSPARLIGTQNAPIDVEELTPKPTRRLLFPSPGGSDTTKSADLGSSPPAKSKPLAFDASDRIDFDQDDKENLPPPREYDNSALDNLFEEREDLNPRPTTPTPTGKSEISSTFKTPKNSRTPHRLPPTTGDFFSSTAKALLQPRTPKRSATLSGAQPLGEITPFTAHLNLLFSEANDSPSANFDFPSLPSLQNTPGGTRNEYDFSNLDSQDFLSTDAPMPSSPPVWFGVYEDPIEQDTGVLFGDYQVSKDEDTVDLDGTTLVPRTPKTPGLIIDEHGRASIDFTAMG